MKPTNHPPAVPQQLPPPPRLVGRRRGRRGVLGHVPLTVQLLCVAGIGLLLLALWLLASSWLVTLFGTTGRGEVTGKSAPRAKGPRTWRVQFTYRVKGTEYSSEDSVDEGDFDGLQVGTRVEVRVLSGWPSHPLLARPVGHAGRGGGVCLWFAILCNVGLGVLLWLCLRQRLRERALVREGVATEGVVVSKEIGSGRRPSWAVQYCYRAPRYGGARGVGEGREEVAEKEWQVLMAVGPMDFEAAQIGATVTVLYDPRQPSRSLLYRFAEYEVVGSFADPRSA